LKKILFLIIYLLTIYHELYAGNISADLYKKWNNTLVLSKIMNLTTTDEEFKYIDKKYKKGKFNEVINQYPFKAYLYCKATNIPLPDFELNESYRNYFNPDRFNRVSIIFVSHQIHIPASMFGHTFITFKEGDRLSPIDKSIDFVGIIGNEKFYGLKSLFYHIPGRFHLKTFIEKRNEYDRENRDLWEYELKVPENIVFEMKLFSVELSQNTYEYNFLTENCSDYIFRFFKVWPELKIDKTFFIAIPLETIKVIHVDNNLIQNREIYPSTYSKTIDLYTKLNDNDRDEFNKLMKRIDKGERINESASPETIAALSSYLNFKIKNEQNYYIRENAVELKKKYHEIGFTPFLPDHPIESHSPLRFDSSYNLSSDGADYFSFGIRPAMHSIYDPLSGYQKNTSIEVLSAKINIEHEKKDMYVSEFSLISIESFIPGTILSDQFTRYIKVAYEENSIKEREFSRQGYAKIGSGFSYQFCNSIIASLGFHAGVIDYYYDDNFFTWLVGSRPRINISFNKWSCDILLNCEYDKFSGKNLIGSTDLSLALKNNFAIFINCSNNLCSGLYTISSGLRYYF